MKTFIRYLSLLLLCLLIGRAATAQPAYVPHHSEPYFLDMGVHDGKITDRKQWSEDRTFTYYPEDYKVVKEIVRAGAVPWMQIKFDDVNLGEHSYMILTSLYDRDFQYFNAKSLADWYNQSAYFKGNAVEVELFVAPNEKDISLKVEEILVGEFLDGDLGQMIGRSQCGPTDDRNSSSIPMRDGRLMPLGCTGWSSAAGYYLTAGHCVNVSSSSLQIMEFDVPASLSNGTTQPAAAINQYPVNYYSRVWQQAGIGDDWGLYNCNANSTSGLTPLEARRSYYHLSRANPTTNIQIRGFGTDDEPPGTTGGRNSDNQTLQYHAGPNLGENYTSADDIDWEYQADTEGGNSGSSIRAYAATGMPDLHHAIGIHTHAGCTNPLGSGGNHGTSFEANDTESAMNTYWQTQTEYADIDHYSTSSIGSSVYPHYTIQGALNQANAGHGPGRELIMIAGSNRLSSSATESGGVYSESVSFSGASNGALLRRTAGAVRIGPNATAPAAPQESGPEAVGITDPKTELVIDENIHHQIRPSVTEGAFSLMEYSKVYPNPFDQSATLELLLNEDKYVSVYVLNSMGQQVGQLADHELYTIGLHKLEIDGSRLSQGVYYVMIKCNGLEEIHKISVIK